MQTLLLHRNLSTSLRNTWQRYHGHRNDKPVGSYYNLPQTYHTPAEAKNYLQQRGAFGFC
ncbi:hypothetical protein [Chitinophaga skermanii]|uniref:hypothetical protein n=1 Tax=Chitinophaga skermanii TaxID=331697 RepID=UPI0011E5EA7B|nr:hypothetical protein [Chitinophaga skermanii]